MQRVTLTLDDELVAEIEHFMQAGGYTSRSEAFRDIARAGLQRLQEDEGDKAKSCVAALVYVYERDVRELSKRLAAWRAEHHDLMISTLSVDLDHASCMEVALMRGATREVRHLSAHITSERGVRHGRLVVVPVEVSRETHSHGQGRTHVHDHFKVKEGG